MTYDQKNDTGSLLRHLKKIMISNNIKPKFAFASLKWFLNSSLPSDYSFNLSYFVCGEHQTVNWRLFFFELW